jgi:hypothetical protein
LDKFTDQVNKNNELMKIVEKTDPNKVKDLEMQLEKLSTENEIKKTNREKRKQPIQKKDKWDRRVPLVMTASRVCK